MGHNKLQTVVSSLMEKAGYSGHYTNHSLRVSAATRLFDLGIDEQLIMSRTGHSSTGGVRTYKCTSEKLKELTSDTLNGITVSSDAPLSKKVKANPVAADENIAPADYKQPVFQISGGSNITINISSK